MMPILLLFDDYHSNYPCRSSKISAPGLGPEVCSNRDQGQCLQELTYTVEHNSKKNQKLHLLKRVTGLIFPAQMTALVRSVVVCSSTSQLAVA